ncbi:MAG: hypothetical protein AAB539_03925 [Patescibacteria group bacterium]
MTYISKKFSFALRRIVPIGAAVMPLAASAQAPSLTNIQQLVVSALNIVNIVTIFLFVLAIVVFAWGVILFIGAAGDPAAVKKARGVIIWGIVGIAVLASVFGLVSFLQTSFGVGGQGTLEIPDVEQEGPTGTPLGP